jgi:hypothetical protein
MWTEETPKHLLLACPETGSAREVKYTLKTNLDLSLLLRTKNRTEATLQFLRTTNIVTRKWHLDRREEEEAEEGEEEEAREEEVEGERESKEQS